jgi:hypothetical protein
METTAILAAVNAALDITTQLLPLINQLAAKGEVTPEQQAELLARYNSLKTQADGQFTGPAWQV